MRMMATILYLPILLLARVFCNLQSWEASCALTKQYASNDCPQEGICMTFNTPNPRVKRWDEL